jgi:dihydropteroate synthase
MQKRYQWKLKQRDIVLGDRTLLMGVLNVTPDSFSDGGKYSDPDRAFARAMEMEDEGADILDIGAESTRPGSQRIPEAEELRRLVPLLKRLRGRLAIPISVDTYKSGVAEKALEHGAEIINDPSGILLDLHLPRVVTKYDAGLIINHMRGTPETWAKLPPIKDLMRSIAIDLDAALHRARQVGVQKHQIVIDPGLGFGKRREQNSEILANLGELRVFDLPILVGPSRKSFLKKEQEVSTEFATAGAVAAGILNGASIVRVHDVKAMKSVVEVVDAIRQAMPGETEMAPPQVRWQRGQ